MRRLHEKGPSELPKGLFPDPASGPFSPEKKSCVLYLSTCLADPRVPTIHHSVFTYLFDFFFALLFFLAFFAFFFAMSTSCWKSEAFSYRPISQARIPTTPHPPTRSIEAAGGASQEKIGVLEKFFETAPPGRAWDRRQVECRSRSRVRGSSRAFYAGTRPALVCLRAGFRLPLARCASGAGRC